MIIVGTGSREHDDVHFIRLVMNSLYVKYGPFILFHGACQFRNGRLRGADKHMDEWARTMRNQGIGIKTFPADWDGPLGNAAGPVRNRQMIDEALATETATTMIQCVAFPLGRSKGTWDAAKYAASRHIITVAHIKGREPQLVAP